ncbi:MAG: hypothetical protein M3T55_09360, partial [Pseudomonadota bacterium]|nr:hypothetical protein [Pseudomonadota bacterium]
FKSSSDVLVVEAGSTFVGSVAGGGGTLGVVSATGTVTFLAGDQAAVSGSMAPTTFSNFGTVKVGAAATFTTVRNSATTAASVANPGTIALAAGGPAVSLVFAANTTLTGGGTVSLGTALVNRLYGAASTVTLTNVDNTISGSGFIGLRRLTLINQSKGVIDAVGGTIAVNTAGKSLTNAGLMEATAGGRLDIQSTTVGNSAASGCSVGLENATIVGGTLQSSGTGRFATFFVTNLIDATTSAVTSQATVSVSDGTALTMQGQVVNSGRILVNAASALTHLTVGSAGLTLSGGGTVSLSNNALNHFSGVTATATLTNVDNTITGAGQLGDKSMILVNQAKGTIDANGSVALIINTGTATIANAGTIEATGSGGATIVSVVANTGVLEAAGGVLTADGAVSGSGTAVIAAGTADFASTFSEAVAFTGKSGVLELARSQSYAGSITGFSKTGGTALDLRDIAFKSAGEATFSGTATSGVLTVTDGTHTAKITLIGDYRTSTFTASSDGHGGVTVVDPTKVGGASVAPPHAFIAAMAGLGAGAGTAAHATADAWRGYIPALAGPRVCMA